MGDNALGVWWRLSFLFPALVLFLVPVSTQRTAPHVHLCAVLIGVCGLALAL